ncbi:HAMP domain-containing histidine kinase [Corynebacterium sp. TAE3-ERU12]|nr:HAMP domain-containing histidine kinase [Corynebacterium sp. TAE3-ERU12]
MGRASRDWFFSGFRYFRTVWRTSLQARVIIPVLIVTSLVVGVVGVGLVSIVTSRLLDQKLAVANEEIDRARITVEQEVSELSADTLQAQLNVVREALVDRNETGDQGLLAVYQPVLIAPGDTPGSIVSSPGNLQIPKELRAFVQQNQVSYQYATIDGADDQYSALIIGTPVSSDINGLELYLIMPLTAEQSTLSLVRGLFAGAAFIMILLLIGIVWLFANQVTAPVRQAAKIAERFARGHLRERMTVQGEDEMARLAVSFNLMAESLSQQIRQLEEYGSLQRQFTSDVSHELRTPLTTVRMAADLIADGAEDLDPTTQRASELMIDELDRFEMLLNDLLEISRHDAGVAELSAERIDLRQCVTAAMAPLTVVARDVGAEVRQHLPEEPLLAEVDTRRVERVLRNLLANAIDHSEGKPIDIDMAANETAVGITVTDHGVGIKPSQEELVFNRFWRADPSRERRTGGTGLGLAIAREDAMLHGGTLDAHGFPSGGSRFRLTLPLVAGEPLGQPPLALDAPPHPIDPDAEPERPAESEPAEPEGAELDSAGPHSNGPVIDPEYDPDTAIPEEPQQ